MNLRFNCPVCISEYDIRDNNDEIFEYKFTKESLKEHLTTLHTKEQLIEYIYGCAEDFDNNYHKDIEDKK